MFGGPWVLSSFTLIVFAENLSWRKKGGLAWERIVIRSSPTIYFLWQQNGLCPEDPTDKGQNIHQRHTCVLSNWTNGASCGRVGLLSKLSMVGMHKAWFEIIKGDVPFRPCLHRFTSISIWLRDPFTSCQPDTLTFPPGINMRLRCVSCDHLWSDFKGDSFWSGLYQHVSAF